MNNYAGVLGLGVLRGRWFDSRDHAGGAPVAVIDERFSREAFPDTNPIGQQILIDEPDSENDRWHTIIGVSNEVLMGQKDDPDWPAVFVPLAQAPQRFLTVAVHTRGDPLAFSQSLRETVRELDEDIPVYWVRTLDNWIWAGSFTSRIVSALFGIFAIIALLLAAAGIYGVLSYSVSQRTREIGVRRAMGALDRRILGMVLQQGMFQLGVGLAIGLLCAVGFARLLGFMLRGVSPFDLFTLMIVTLTLFVVALAAALLPSLRAMRISPIEALRYE
jgi:predicted permease